MKWILLVLILTGCTNNNDDMRLFQTMLPSEQSPQPTLDYRLAPDGYLYILGFGQSNFAGTSEGTDDWLPLTGDASLGDRTPLPNTCTVAWNNGTWRQMAYGDGVIYDADNILAFGFARELATNHPEVIGNGIRMVFIAQGGANIEQFMVGGVKYDEMVAMYSAFTMGDDIYPASLVLMHQGESNDNEEVSVYVPKWDECVGQYYTNGWTDDPTTCRYIVGEIGRNKAVSNALFDIGWANENRRISNTDGLDKSQVSHYLGTGYNDYGIRYADRYIEILNESYPVIGQEVRPNNVKNIVASDIDATGCTLTWQYPDVRLQDLYFAYNGQETDRDLIVGFNVCGWGGYKRLFQINDKNQLTTRVNFSLPSGSTEYFGVYPFDSFGNQCLWNLSGDLGRVAVVVP